MNDAEKAKELLRSGKTCALVLGDTEYASEETGIRPMVGFLDEKIYLKGFSAADRIVGKAAALLFALAGVKYVYGEVMSKGAVKVLKEYGISYGYSTLADEIVNRRGDGKCPMEQAVENIDVPKQALAAIKDKLASLRAESKR